MGQSGQRRTARRFPLEQIRLLSDLPERFKNITFLSDLPASTEGRDWWDEIGFWLSLKFDMKPGSRSWPIWDAYREPKGL